MSDYAALALCLRDWPCLVVGASNVAARRVRRLLESGARLTVVAPEVGTLIAELAAAGTVTLHRRVFTDTDLDGQRLVVAATDDAELNRAIGQAAEQRGILANVVSEGRAGSVLFPAHYRSDGLEVTVHGHGRDVHRSVRIRDRIANFLEATGALHGAAVGADDRSGRVYLIGAGPGAADLLTLRALRAIQASDVVICDHILGARFLEDLDLDLGDKELIWLGSARDCAGRQGAINERLVRCARAGRTVARVKNGDPLVFGRGGEEGEWLTAHDVRWEFVPGLSSSVSTLTNAGYPVTNRGNGRSFAVVSARLAGGDFNERFPVADSLIFLMGFKVMPTICERLAAEGWGSDTPVVIIERGSMAFEKRVAGTLADITARARAAGISSPAILAVGVVAEQRYASPLRPTILCTAVDPSPYRGLGDLLHWPSEDPESPGKAHPELGKPLPAVDCCLVTRPIEWQLLRAAHPQETGVLPIWVQDEATAAAVGTDGSSPVANLVLIDR